MIPDPDTLLAIEAAVPLPLHSTYHYLVPSRLASGTTPGVRVLVPFGRRRITAYVLDVLRLPAQCQAELKEVLEILDPEPLVTAAEVAFFRWSAAYYLHPLGEVLKAALPAGINVQSRSHTTLSDDGALVTGEILSGGRNVKTAVFYSLSPSPGLGRTLSEKAARVLKALACKKELSADVLRREAGADSALLKRLVDRGLVQAEEREVYRDPFREEVFERDRPLPLNVHQAKALARIHAAIDDGTFTPFLLHGVTGSGKTEIYLQAIARVRDSGKSALVLVPEIALTPQLVKRFKRRFQHGIAVLHSGLSPGERYDEWRRIRRGEAAIVIGARSAIFAPLADIGIIVVDEEHESSFKQSEGFRYNARDLALVRGKMEKAAVILGSATPLVTSRQAADEGKLLLLSLPERVRDLPLPDTETVDMRHRKGETFSPRLRTLLEENLAQGGQALLFLNRRGFASWVVCQECGTVLRCPNCAVTLTYHQRKGLHVCHYCDHSIPAPSLCPSCMNGSLALFGRGTERVEEDVTQLLPEARIARMDRDTTRGRGGFGRIIADVEKGKIDILIGTQMIAKGHDFPGVTLVGVVNADASLNLPDFRSGERTFQLISQVIGRAGRGDQPGRVVIQSMLPEHYAVKRAAEHDYEGFFNEELSFRRELSYPPFSFLAAITLSSTNMQLVERGGNDAGECLGKLKRELKSRIEILGPATPPLGKIRGRFRCHLLLKSSDRTALHRLVGIFRQRVQLPSMVRMAIDIDPVDLL